MKMRNEDRGQDHGDDEAATHIDQALWRGTAHEKDESRCPGARINDRG